MTLNELMQLSLSEALSKLDIHNVQIHSDDDGFIRKIAVEYTPLSITKNKTTQHRGNN